jgi:hypothetical protein
MAPFFYSFIILYIFMDENLFTIMKNIFVILFLSLFFPAISFPQSVFVTEGNARTVAEKIYFERIQPHRPVTADNIKVINSLIVEENQVILYYIFNFLTGGFVAVSACNATPPVLCYAFSGKYEQFDQPENFKAWMEQYKRQIFFSIKSKAVPSEETYARWKYFLETPLSAMRPFSGREILPLTTSTWDQGTYYNEMCPADPAGPSGHCVTGCVATAMGQVMNYFRWPETGTGSYTYECPPYGTLSAHFDSANYQWDLMETSLGHSNPEVAELLFHLGVSVDMVYGPDGSGMYNHKAAYSLKTFFKYSPETRYVFRDSTSMDWDSLIVAHLDKKIPMYYAGWSVPDTNGHAFVCDGCQGEDYFHFNWGWGGSYDGYFYTDNLTPGGNYFNLAQELIINAVPDTNLYDYPIYCEGQKNYTSLYGTIEDGSGPLYSYQNETVCSWLITPADSVNGIILSFLKFSTDTNDFVTVYDGDDITAPVLGIFSGSDLPLPVSSTGNSMFVVFESGPGVTGEGFLASFESEIPLYCSGTVVLTAQSDTLSDGSGHWDYHNNSSCFWRIMPEGASSVTLYFTEFETDAGFDFLKIYNLQSGQLLAEYTGSYSPGVPGPVTSPSGKMFLTFSTDFSVTAPGWKAYYESNLVNITEQGENSDMLIFPNPTDGLLTVQLKDDSGFLVKLSLTDLSGRKVFYQEIHGSGEKQMTIDLRHLSPGIYILNSDTGTGSIEYDKVIIH